VCPVLIMFDIWTHVAKYSGTVEVTDPTDSEQLEAGARKTATTKGLQAADVDQYRAYRLDGVPLTGKVTVARS
jgi:hypothetical protein